MEKKHWVIYIRGLVQGVGFRPFVYRTAAEMKIGQGNVSNHTGGVLVRAILTETECRALISRLKEKCPPPASIHSIRAELCPEPGEYTGFTIAASRTEPEEITQVAPDIAVCGDCLADRKKQPHRLYYPFINCTHCGPRFSIIKDLPYDRERTTMAGFTMCTGCRREFADVSDRRFHAQPIACNQCGPAYYARYEGEDVLTYGQALALTVKLIREEEVIAVKGVGGYHLVCDAGCTQAVDRLRSLKARDSKPFAVMFKDVESVRRYAFLSLEEERELTSWRRPVVLLRQRRPLAQGVNPGMRTLGVMLPYLPLHYDWFGRMDLHALVMTSGNRSDQPIAITPEEAVRQWGGHVPLILHHSRPIHNRVDDSVTQVCGGVPSIIRRSRGYVPEPFFAGVPVEGILAFGAGEANTFALGRGDMVFQSQHIGDLKNWETFSFYRESLEHFQRLFRFTPRLLACDRHPDYLSTQEAVRRAAELPGIELLHIQHHHAHAVACMAEHGLDEPVLALVMDGAGLGDDQTIWGGEFLACDRHAYQRLAHLAAFPLPGADRVSYEPWRSAVSLLHTCGLPFPAAFVKRVGGEKLQTVRRMIDRQVNSPLSSGAGRVFDAVASLLGICDASSHPGEAPVLLEQCIAVRAADVKERPYAFSPEGEALSMRPLLEGLLEDMASGVGLDVISTRFHVTFAELLVEKACLLLRESRLRSVVASGGCFQNKFLSEYLRKAFAGRGIPFYLPSRLPANDGGISVGQLLIAAEQRRRTD